MTYIVLFSELLEFKLNVDQPICGLPGLKI